MFYPYEGYRSVTPLDAARVNRTIFLTFLFAESYGAVRYGADFSF